MTRRTSNILTALGDHGAARERGPLSTTRRELVRWRFGLLAGTVVTLACVLLPFEGANSAISAVHDNGLPSVVYSLDAAKAVVAANHAMAVNFATTTDITLTGIGRDYQADLDLATQNLEQVAGVNQAGAAGGQAIQSVDGQLATYTQLVDQADAAYARGEDAVGAAEAWHATQLMASSGAGIRCDAGAETGGVLDDLSTLCGAELSAVDAQGSSLWTGWPGVVLWIGPTVLLVVAFIWVQRYLSRRFRRTYNWWLVAATVLLCMLAAFGVARIVSDEQFAAARSELRTAVTEQDDVIGAAQADGAARVVALVRARCGSPIACGPTIDGAASATKSTSIVDDSAVHITASRTELDAADVWSGTLYLVLTVGCALAAAFATLIGLQRRINEYGYQP